MSTAPQKATEQAPPPVILTTRPSPAMLAPTSPPVLPETAAPARLPPAALWRGWGDDDGPTI